jgi:hypothetical protein
MTRVGGKRTCDLRSSQGEAKQRSNQKMQQQQQRQRQTTTPLTVDPAGKICPEQQTRDRHTLTSFTQQMQEHDDRQGEQGQ